MSFYSILYQAPEDHIGDDSFQAQSFFNDLNCDQIVASITTGKDEYDLKPFFNTPLHRVGAINYRQEVMRDLEDDALRQCVNAFTQAMREIRDYLLHARKAHYREQQQAWFLDAVETYCRGIATLTHDLQGLQPKSRGFCEFKEHLTEYIGSSQFRSLVLDAGRLRADLAAIKYCVHIKGDGFTVRTFQDEADYSADVEATFRKFKQGATRDYTVQFKATEDMNHIEAKILEFVAKLNLKTFAAMGDFFVRQADFIDPSIATFDREIQFYLAYLEYIVPLRHAGLPFCFPRISEQAGNIYSDESFDMALAHKLVTEGSIVVRNDFHLSGIERIIVVSGPNQGGKTTFARTFGQLHYLASIGCPVPGLQAELFLFDRIFTHFEKEEKVENLRGKLEDDLERVHDILNESTSRSLIVLNEIFTSTTVHDETFLGGKIMEKILALGALCAWVTFVDELASFAPQVVSMVSTTVPGSPAMRTFKIIRKPADGLAYAVVIAQKYRLTYGAIKERIRS